MNADNLIHRLQEFAAEGGVKAFGIADIDKLKKDIPSLLEHITGDYSHAVVIGIRVQRAVLEDIVDRPTPLYFHHYRQLNFSLDRIALQVAGMIQDAGFRALPVPASQTITREPMKGHISHRLLGWAAGIGFIGRSTLLVHPQYGAQMRYASVLTDMVLPVGECHTESCGSCRACIEACPASAIKEESSDFDLDKCYTKLTEFTKLPFVGQHICGVCVKTCPGKK